MDLNLDAGESSEALLNGTEEALYQWVTSVNIACGGHAGDEATMSRAVELARNYNLRIGAHPSYPDRENFGRQILHLSAEELRSSLLEQMEALRRICKSQGVRLTHVKPHGALYNLAAVDFPVAQVVLSAIADFDSHLCVVGLAGSRFLQWCRDVGLRPLAEAFADRRYEPDGSLRKRSFADAVIGDPEQAAAQAVQIACEGKIGSPSLRIQADTICVHGDSPGALAMARKIRSFLEQKGVRVQPYSCST